MIIYKTWDQKYTHERIDGVSLLELTWRLNKTNLRKTEVNIKRRKVHDGTGCELLSFSISSLENNKGILLVLWENVVNWDPT